MPSHADAAERATGLSGMDEVRQHGSDDAQRDMHAQCEGILAKAQHGLPCKPRTAPSGDRPPH